MNKAIRALPRLILGVVLTALPWCGLSAQEIPQWRMQAGDDLAWAEPDFDDSTWQTVHWPELTRLPDPFRIRWYRASIDIDPGFAGQELAIALAPFDEVFEVYVEGKLVGSHGEWFNRDRSPFPRQHVFRVPAATRLRIAIRRWTGATVISYRPLLATGILAHTHPPVVGSPLMLHLSEELHQFESWIAWIPNWIGMVVLFCGGMVSLALYLAERSKVHNLWFSLTLISMSASPLLGVLVSLLGPALRSEWSVIAVGMQGLGVAAQYLWLRSICPRFGRFLAWVVVFQVGVTLIRGVSFYCQIPIAEWYVTQNLQSMFMMLIVVFVGMGLLFDGRNLNSLLLTAAAFVAASAQYWRVNGSLGGVGYLRPWGLFLDTRVIAHLLFMGLGLAGLYLKHLEDRRKQEILDRDLGAARMVQDSLLVAAGSPEWEVDAVYLPANEVGGDFYHTTLAKDGSLLVVTGDVSGKGLPASLLVAAVVGALGDLVSREPAAVLAHLNRSLLGKTRGGFVTCACALFHADGQVVLANAGHLSPWVDGQELELEPGLPLGVVDGVAYQEKQANGKRFVFVSDGVVEAANAKGELFGFERTRHLITKAAQELAEAAKAWGQTDDITVVTVRRNET